MVLLIQESVTIGMLTTKEVRESDVKNEIAWTLFAGFLGIALFNCFYMEFRLTTLRGSVVVVLGILVPLAFLLILGFVQEL